MLTKYIDLTHSYEISGVGYPGTFISLARLFVSRVSVKFLGVEMNLKSPKGMTEWMEGKRSKYEILIPSGTHLTLTVEGDDSEPATNVISKAFESDPKQTEVICDACFKDMIRHGRVLKDRVTIINRKGIHTKPAAWLVRIASCFEAEILLKKDPSLFCARSIIGMMTLAAAQGEELEIFTAGENAQGAMKDMLNFFETGFGEL